MAEELPDPEHLEWLVENRAANQRTSAKLYRLFKEYPKQVSNRPFASQAQALVAIGFSLWRSAFLSDKTGLLSDTNEDAEWFLGELLLTNNIAFPQDRKAKDWTFNYYAANAKFRLEIYAANYPGDFELGQVTAKSPKDRWKNLQHEFERAVEHFRLQLKTAAEKPRKP
jgi:hypothetical protein